MWDSSTASRQRTEQRRWDGDHGGHFRPPGASIGAQKKHFRPPGASIDAQKKPSRHC